MWARRPFGLVSPAVKPGSRSHASASLIVRVLNINQSCRARYMMFHSQYGLWNERYPVDGSTSVPSLSFVRRRDRAVCGIFAPSIGSVRSRVSYNPFLPTVPINAKPIVGASPASSNCCSGTYLLPIHPNPSFRNVSPIMEEENPDDIAPLWHLFSSDDSDDLLLPAPPPPRTDDQIVQVNFLAPLNHQPEESYRTISLSLSVDPRPGCGGIAWPAGEVGSAFLTVVIYRHRYLLFCSLFIVIMTRHCPTCVICRS